MARGEARARGFGCRPRSGRQAGCAEPCLTAFCGLRRDERQPAGRPAASFSQGVRRWPSQRLGCPGVGRGCAFVRPKCGPGRQLQSEEVGGGRSRFRATSLWPRGRRRGLVGAWPARPRDSPGDLEQVAQRVRRPSRGVAGAWGCRGVCEGEPNNVRCSDPGMFGTGQPVVVMKNTAALSSPLSNIKMAFLVINAGTSVV